MTAKSQQVHVLLDYMDGGSLADLCRMVIHSVNINSYHSRSFENILFASARAVSKYKMFSSTAN